MITNKVVKNATVKLLKIYRPNGASWNVLITFSQWKCSGRICKGLLNISSLDFIDPNNIKDTLSLSLGRDKRIVVKREKQKELSSRKFIGTNQKESYTWEISIRNTKAEAIKISLEDQIPVSQNSQIEVTAIDIAGAKYNKGSGKLSWDLNLQPNETKKIVFKYEVKYPKDKQVNGL